MVQIFRRTHSPEPEFQIHLEGLNPEAVYLLDFFTGESEERSGRELASMVIRLEQPRSFQIIRYRIK